MAEKKYEKLRELIGANFDQQQQQGRLDQLAAERPAFLKVCESFVDKFGSAQKPVRSAAGPSTSILRIKPDSHPNSSPSTSSLNVLAEAAGGAQPSTSSLNVLAEAAGEVQPCTSLPRIKTHSSPPSSPAQRSISFLEVIEEAATEVQPSASLPQIEPHSSPQSFLEVIAEAATVTEAQPSTSLHQIEPYSSPQPLPAQQPSPSVPGPEIHRAFSPPPTSTVSQLARSSSLSLSHSQRNAVPDRPLRVTSRSYKASGSGSSLGPRTRTHLSRQSSLYESQSMAFFSPQPQQASFQQQQTPQLTFQPPQQQFPGQFQVQQPQLSLYTKDKVPAGWNTKFSDLHEDSQKLLLQIEGKMREFRQESEKLDQCVRLYDSSVSNDSFEVDATRIVQELGGTNTAIEREKASLQELITNVKDMIRRTELAIHTYMMIRARFTKSNTGTAQNTGTASIQPVNQIVPASPVMPVFDFYTGVPKRPSAFMQQTVDRLQKYLEDCERWIEELEQLVQIDANRRGSDSLVALPKVMSNLHSYFIYVASKAEKLHQYVESMRTAYLIEQRRHGSNADPFLEADRREAARLEAAARRVHPTLHLPATQNPPQQPNTQNPTPTPTFQQQTLQPNPMGFLTPAPASSGGGLFSTPSGSAPSSALFGPSAGFTPQSTPFGSTSGSLFGSTPTPAFGSTTPGLSSTPAIGAGSALFATPSFGGANVSGASFGGASKSSRPKTRTSRR